MHPLPRHALPNAATRQPLTMTVTQHLPGVWVVECYRCGYVTACLFLEHDRACQLADQHIHS